jgi:hypothetical protein
MKLFKTSHRPSLYRAPREAERATKSLPSTSRRSERKSLYREPCEVEQATKSLPSTSRGGAGDQVSAEQAREGVQAIKSLSSNPTRQSGQPSPCRAPHEAEGKGRPNAAAPHQWDKTHHHRTTSGPRVR